FRAASLNATRGLPASPYATARTCSNVRSSPFITISAISPNVQQFLPANDHPPNRRSPEFINCRTMVLRIKHHKVRSLPQIDRPHLLVHPYRKGGVYRHRVYHLGGEQLLISASDRHRHRLRRARRRTGIIIRRN